MRILLIAALALVSACGDGSDSSVMETAAEAVDAVQAMRVPACDDTQVVQAVGLQIRESGFRMGETISIVEHNFDDRIQLRDCEMRLTYDQWQDVRAIYTVSTDLGTGYTTVTATTIDRQVTAATAARWERERHEQRRQQLEQEAAANQPQETAAVEPPK